MIICRFYHDFTELSSECTFFKANIIRRIYTRYNDDVAAIDFMTGKVLEGHLPQKAMNMVEEWISIYIDREDLKTIWETQEFKSLPPLE